MGFLDTNEIRTRYTARDETTAVTQKVQRSLGDMVTSAQAAAAGALAVGAAVGVMVSQSISAAREIQAFNSRLGVSVEALQELRFAAAQNNVAFSQVTIGMQRMTRRVAEAAQGMGEAQGALKELNIDAAELSRLAPDKQFGKIAEALTGVTSQSDKVRLAFKLFDSEGVGLIQMFDDMGPSVDEAAERLRELNGVMGSDDIAQLDEAARAWGEIGVALKAVGDAITTGLVEGLDSGGVADFLGKLAPFAGKTTEIFITGLTPAGRLEQLQGAVGAIPEGFFQGDGAGASERLLLQSTQARNRRTAAGVAALGTGPLPLPGGDQTAVASDLMTNLLEKVLEDAIRKAGSGATLSEAESNALRRSLEQGVAAGGPGLGPAELREINKEVTELGIPVRELGSEFDGVKIATLDMNDALRDSEIAAMEMAQAIKDEEMIRVTDRLTEGIAGLIGGYDDASNAVRRFAVIAIQELTRILIKTDALSNALSFLGIGGGGGEVVGAVVSGIPGTGAGDHINLPDLAPGFDGFAPVAPPASSRSTTSTSTTNITVNAYPAFASRGESLAFGRQLGNLIAEAG